LLRQLLFAPIDKRIEQVVRAEKLHDNIDMAMNYPFDYVQYQMTGHRSVGNESNSTVLVGEAIRPDLRLIIDALSRSVDMPAQGQVESPQALAQRLKVSTKTIERWRKKGLRWRWVIDSKDQRKRIVFTRDAIEYFLAQNSEQVARASSFTHIPDDVRTRLIQRARRIRAARPLSLNHIASHLAKRTGRGVETMRTLLEQHDRDNPNDAIFAGDSGPLTGQDIRQIARAYRQGESVPDLAVQYQRTRASIYRAIHLRHAAVLKRVKLHFIESKTFVRDDADQVILRNQPDVVRRDTDIHVDDLPPPLQQLYSRPAIDAAHLGSLFVRYNYLKYKASKLRHSLDLHHPGAIQIDLARQCIRDAGQLRDQLVIANLHVVLSVARRHMIDQPDASTNRLLRLLDAGNEVLLKQVEQHDASKRQTFETSLTWQLQREYASQHAHDAQSSRAIKRLTPDQITAKLPRV